MAKIGENLRTVALSIPGVSAITDRMGQNIVRHEDDLPYIYYRRISEERPIDVDGSPGLTTTIFTVETVSRDIDEAIDLADLIRDGLTALSRGDFGDQYVLGIQAEDKDDSYIYENPSGDGIHIVAFTVTLIFKGL